MVRTPCCRAEGLKKGAWTQEEDQKLIAYVQQHGEGGWRTLPDKAGLKRCGKSCRLRWANYLRPDIKRGEFSQEEENSMIRLHAIHGNKWSAIARSLPGRTDNEIKNHWNTHIKKRLVKKGIDPLTHKSLLDGAGKSSYHPENPPEKTSVQQKEDDQILDNNKSPGSLSARFLNRVANRFGQRINHSALSNIIGSGGPLTSQSSHTTSASECEKSTSSSSTPTSSKFLVSQNMNLDATSLSSSTFSDSSMYDNIFGDIEDMTRFSSRFLSDAVSHDDEKFLMVDKSCLENTSFMRELTMILQEDIIMETTSLCDSHVTLVDEADDSFEGIDNYFG